VVAAAIQLAGSTNIYRVDLVCGETVHRDLFFTFSTDADDIILNSN